jgi:hypothetical protein
MLCALLRCSCVLGYSERAEAAYERVRCMLYCVVRCLAVPRFWCTFTCHMAALLQSKEQGLRVLIVISTVACICPCASHL